MKLKKRHITVLALFLVLSSFLIWRRVSDDKNFAVVSSTGSNEVVVGEETNVQVFLDVKEKNVNAVKIIILFDNDKVLVKRFDVDESVFNIWIDDRPKVTDEGMIIVEGGIPTPGFSGSGLLGEIVLEGKEKGAVKFLFDKESKVLLNDGLGSEVSLRTETIKVIVK